MWQLLWNFCGAGSVLPRYLSRYLKRRPIDSQRVAAENTQALFLAAMWSMLSSLPLLMPGVLGTAAPFGLEDGVVIWFFSPLVLSALEALTRSLLPPSSKPCSRWVTARPAAAVYSLLGVVSAAVHVGVVWRTYRSPDLTWGRVYVPNHSVVQPGPAILIEGAMLFIQYGYLIFQLSVLALGAYVFLSNQHLAARAPTKKLKGGRSMIALASITAVAGPGAGLAWLLVIEESFVDAEDPTTKEA